MDTPKTYHLSLFHISHHSSHHYNDNENQFYQWIHKFHDRCMLFHLLRHKYLYIQKREGEKVK